MVKDFIQYTEAFALKELGFNEPCLGYYLCRNSAFGIDDLEITTERIDLIRYDYASCAVPTFSQAFRWFREKHGLNSFVYHYGKDGILDTIYFAYNINDNLYASDFRTHEEAELACLKKLIEIVKNK
jgi:hypothetical protein